MSWRVPARKPVSRAPPPSDFQACIAAANDLLETVSLPKLEDMPDDRIVFDDSCRHLLWFLLPFEAACLIAGQTITKIPCPIRPGTILPCTAGNRNYVNSVILKTSQCSVTLWENSQSIVTSPESSHTAVTSSENSQSIVSSPEISHSALVAPMNSVTLTSSETSQVPAISLRNSENSSGTCGLTLMPSKVRESTIKAPDDEETEERNVEINGEKEKENSVPQNRNRQCKRQNKQNKTVCSKKAIEYRYLWRPPIKEIFKPVLQAMDEFKMIENGDKVLVCLSGGKDSLSLLHTLHQYQRYAAAKEIKFELGAATVDPGTPAYDPSPLIPYLAQLGVPYFYEKQDIIDTAVNLPYECDSICAFCSRMKRGRLYACARREGYNVLAMGQHLDDLAESFLMSLFHNGSLRTMKANYHVKEGDLRIVRPFAFVREKHTRQFADQANLPVIPENCPACFEAPKERFRLKQLMAEQEVIHPKVYHSISSALRPLMALERGDQLRKHENDEETKLKNCVDDVCDFRTV